MSSMWSGEHGKGSESGRGGTGFLSGQLHASCMVAQTEPTLLNWPMQGKLRPNIPRPIIESYDRYILLTSRLTYTMDL